jgi:hypothetical protein
MITSRLERTWWFIAIVSALAFVSAAGLMQAAGLPFPYTGVAQWVLHGLCFFAFQRGYSHAGWLLVLVLVPSSPMLERRLEK